jgi:hypothetical protein
MVPSFQQIYKTYDSAYSFKFFVILLLSYFLPCNFVFLHSRGADFESRLYSEHTEIFLESLLANGRI